MHCVNDRASHPSPIVVGELRKCWRKYPRPALLGLVPRRTLTPGAALRAMRAQWVAAIPLFGTAEALELIGMVWGGSKGGGGGGGSD